MLIVVGISDDRRNWAIKLELLWYTIHGHVILDNFIVLDKKISTTRCRQRQKRLYAHLFYFWSKKRSYNFPRRSFRQAIKAQAARGQALGN